MLLSLACSSPSPPEGDWVAWDLHVHSSVGSNDTDGEGLPELLAAAMERAGLQGVFITDHSNSSGSMDCEDVEDCPNRGPEFPVADWPEGVWAGSELSPVETLEGYGGAVGHIGCLAPDPQGFPELDHFIDRPPGAITGGEALRQCQEAGGWAIVNHPFAAAPWIEYDWTSEEYDALEIYNGGTRFDPWDAETVAIWEQSWLEGRGVVGVGGSDCHRWGTEAPGGDLDPALGYPTTWIHQRPGETVLDALRMGRVLTGEPESRLRWWAHGEAAVAGPGESIQGPVRLDWEARVSQQGLALELRELESGERELLPLEPDQDLSGRFDLTEGIWFLKIFPEDDWSANQGGVMISAPLVVLP